MRSGLILVCLCFCLTIVGCASPERQDPGHDFRKAQAEREQAETRAKASEAESAALREKLAAKQRECDQLKGETDELRAGNARLAALMEQRAAAELSRPEVPESPLPQKLDAALMAYATSLGDRVTYDRARAGMTFANDRLFDSGSADVRADAVASIREFGDVLAAALREQPDEFDVLIVGHTDDTPIRRPAVKKRYPTNWHLSVDRAIGVKDVIVKSGVAEKNCVVLGCGPCRPISDDRAKNRRVEVFLTHRGRIEALEPVKAR